MSPTVGAFRNLSRRWLYYLQNVTVLMAIQQKGGRENKEAVVWFRATPSKKPIPLLFTFHWLELSYMVIPDCT